MKPEVIIKPLPVQWKKEHGRKKQYASYQEEHNGLIYEWIYLRNVNEPDYVVIADMKNEKWWTYSCEDEKWGRATISYIEGYRSRVKYHHVAEDIYGWDVEHMQYKVNSEKLAKKHKKKEDEIFRVMKQEKPITKRQEAWMKKHIEHYALYESGKKEGLCTHCGATFEDTFKMGRNYKCPACKQKLIGKTFKTVPAQSVRTFWIPQKIKNGFMIRVVNYGMIHKEGKNVGFYEYTGRRGIYMTENLRIVVENGKEKWFERRTWYSDAWSKNNSFSWVKQRNSPFRYEKNRVKFEKGNRNEILMICGGEATLNKTEEFKHLDLESFKVFLDCYGQYTHTMFDAVFYAAKFQQEPQVESLYKLGFKTMARSLSRGNYSTAKERELHKYLKIRKETWREMNRLPEREKADVSMVDVEAMQILEGYTTDAKMIVDMGTRYGKDTIQTAVAGRVNLRKLRYYKNATGYMWRDYISMCVRYGMDTQDPFVAFPENINQAHDNMIAIRDEERNKESLRKAAEQDKDILKVYKKIKRKFSIKTEKYEVRPAKSAREIVEEGQKLHHCVGGETYRKKVIEERSFILFLRKREEPDIPFWTIEIKPDGYIVQAYAKYDKKPQYEEEIKPVLDKLTERVKTYGKKHYAAG